MNWTFMAIYLPNLLDHVQLESITSLKGGGFNAVRKFKEGLDFKAAHSS